VGCQQCYTTPSKTCYSRICQELYGCEENKCGSGYIYNEGSGMCDCKEGHGIVLGRCSYKPYKRMPQFSPYYAGGCCGGGGGGDPLQTASSTITGIV
jgi:hypothetical protein